MTTQAGTRRLPLVALCSLSFIAWGLLRVNAISSRC